MCYSKRLKTIIATILLAVLMFTNTVSVSAEVSEVVQVPVRCGDVTLVLGIVRDNGEWYVALYDLATLAGCKASINNTLNIVSLYKEEPFVSLFTASADKYLYYCGDYFVPLQEASLAVGVRFDVDDGINAKVYRTPKEMLSELSRIFLDQRYQIAQLLLSDGFATGYTFAKIYSIMPFVGSASFIKVVSGTDLADQYRIAMTSVLANEGNTSEFVDIFSDLKGDVDDYAMIMDFVVELTKQGGDLYNRLLGEGISRELLDALAYAEDPYEYELEMFQEISGALGTVNFGHFLDIAAFYAVSIDTEESILAAMLKVFKDSDDDYSRQAVEKLINNRFGNSLTAVGDVYGGMLWDLAAESINKSLYDLLLGSFTLKEELLAKVIDKFFRASDIAEALLYFPIYANIQNDLYDYYIEHRYDTEEWTMYDMRAVAIMYIKAAIAAYECASFDKSMASTLETALGTLNNELLNILSYTEPEYAPKYTNQELIDWLNSKYADNFANTGEQGSLSSPESSSELLGNWITYSRRNDTNYIWQLQFADNGDVWILYGIYATDSGIAYFGQWSIVDTAENRYTIKLVLEDPSGEDPKVYHITLQALFNGDSMLLEKISEEHELICYDQWYRRNYSFDDWLEEYCLEQGLGLDDGVYSTYRNANCFDGQYADLYVWGEYYDPFEAEEYWCYDLCRIKFKCTSEQGNITMVHSLRIITIEYDQRGNINLTAVEPSGNYHISCSISPDNSIKLSQTFPSSTRAHDFYGVDAQLSFANRALLRIAFDCVYTYRVTDEVIEKATESTLDRGDALDMLANKYMQLTIRIVEGIIVEAIFDDYLTR